MIPATLPNYLADVTPGEVTTGAPEAFKEAEQEVVSN